MTQFWNEEEPGKGWVHWANRRAANYQRDPLLVFVHGLAGNGRSTWRSAPRLILDKLGIDIDVFTFDYPAGLFEEADIEIAAQTLGTILCEKFGAYRHLIFCAHSAGGLVTKAMIRQELAKAARGCAYRARPYRTANSVTLRLRRIINLDVPHAGGNPFLNRAGKVLRSFFNPLIKMRLCGYNKIIDQLDPTGPEGDYVTQLEGDYVDCLRQLDNLNLPRPTSLEVLAADAGVIAAHDRVAIDSEVWTGSDEPADKSKVWWPKETQKTKSPQYFDRKASRWGTLGSILEIGHAAVAILSDADTIELRQVGHSIAHRMKKTTDLTTSVVSNFLEQWVRKDELRWGVAEIAVKLLHDFHLSQRFDRLVGEKALGQCTLTGVSGSQAFIHGALVEKIAEHIHAPSRFVLTGDLGVGKSILARHLGWRRCLDFLQADNLADPLPCFIPLERVTLDDPVSPQKFSAEAGTGGGWEVLGKNWCDYLAGHLAVDGAWGENTAENKAHLAKRLWQMLEESIQSRPILLILDGVDDFFAKNPQIRLDDFAAAVEWLKQRAANNPRFTLLLGMRSSQPGKELLASPAHTFTVRHLSLWEASTLLPGFARWLARVEKEFRRRSGRQRAKTGKLPASATDLESDCSGTLKVKQTRENLEFYELLLTPFTLCQLGKAILELDPAQLQSRTQILDAILDAIVRRNHPDLERDDAAELITLNARKDMLMAVVWCFYRSRQSEMTVEQILVRLRELVARWSTGDRWKDDCELPAVLHSMQLACEPSRLEKSLLSRTVFYPTSYAGYRFLHREWEDFLAGRYVAACVRHRRAQELGPLSCRQNMLRIAGELLGELHVDRSFVEPFLKTPQKPEDDLIAGNFSAILGSGKSPLDGPAIQQLVESFDRVRGLSPHVLLGTLCWRVLRAGMQARSSGHPVDFFDPAAEALRTQLQPLLRDLTASKPSRLVPAVTRSLAWCYLREFHGFFGEPEPPGYETMGIDLTIPDPAGFKLICTNDGTATTYTETQGTLQNAFLRIQPMIFLDVARPISVVHYLYFISLAAGASAATSEVTAELSKLLNENSPYEWAVRNASPAELLKVYNACRIVAGKR
jgi:pimeloyl-ACP methyl ester carboxylesterase